MFSCMEYIIEWANIRSVYQFYTYVSFNSFLSCISITLFVFVSSYVSMIFATFLLFGVMQGNRDFSFPFCFFLIYLASESEKPLSVYKTNIISLNTLSIYFWHVNCCKCNIITL